MASLDAAIIAAAGDPCALTEALRDVYFEAPTTPDEVKAATEVLARFFEALGAAAPEQRAAFVGTAADLRSEVASSGYAVSALMDSTVMDGAQLSEAIAAVRGPCLTKS